MASEPAPAAIAEGDDVGGFQSIAERLDARERDYLRARVLLDGPARTYRVVADELRTEIERAVPEHLRAPFLAWTRQRKGDLKRVTLNATARFALSRCDWAGATDLAGEVVARDHHDILAQRIVDAAAARTCDLETEADRWLATRTCHAPFRQIETRTNGTVHFCCSAWQPVPIGRLDAADGEGFWRSARAQEIRRSVTEGDFTHCSRWHCPAIAARRLPARSEAAGPRAAPKAPRRVVLSHDRSCNISCPSCRTELITLDHRRSRQLDRLFEERLLPLLDDATEIKVTGSGDPFGSRHFRHVLKTLSVRTPTRRRLQLHTNALLVNERAWNDLHLWDSVTSVWVSVDAACADTYAELRRGGDFQQLLRSLRFLGDLRHASAIDTFRLDFVVQARNYDEMGDFVDLAHRVGADRVYFLRLRNWGHMGAEAFRAIDVCDNGHPEHQRLLARLADPRLRQSGVELGSMTTLADEARRRFRIV